MIEQASRFYAAGRSPVQPRVAATVLLLRPSTPPGASGFEAYLIRRVAAVAFGGVYAFPGGGVDPSDAGTDLRWAGPEPAEWSARLGCPPAEAQAVVCAAAREVFEEAGVLLAGPDGDTVVGDVAGDDWEAERQALLARSFSFGDLLRRRGLTLRADLLAAWSRWITPEFEPRRFDTYFFVARLPAGQVPRDVSGEADHTVWVPPSTALGRADAGQWSLLPPTRVTLAEVGGCADLDGVFAAAAGRDPAVPVRPELRVDPDGTVSFVVPFGSRH
ncbi:NUDIX domain-containing protein [Micromonospora sp. Llam0]|uniref:NUDIX hydrolase n=1 Tax=Micromonospora sp. Llam0 TaxID=2485143 RepID=UPI000F476438|nr:NUDIX domain-containing protein [Micromonospora sp. Llam0]